MSDNIEEYDNIGMDPTFSSAEMGNMDNPEGIDGMKEEDFGEYDNMDKVDVPAYEKKKGNDCVVQGKYEDATKHFSKAILALKFLLQDEKITSQEKYDQIVEEVQIPCHLNNALCFIKLKGWKVAKEHANQVGKLEYIISFTSSIEDPNREAKALYRKAVACMNLEQFDEAKTCVNRANELSPNNNEIIILMHQLANRKKQLNEKEKKMGQKILEGLSASSNETENKNEKKDSGSNQTKSNILKPFSLIQEICCKRKKKDSPEKKNK